MEKIKALIKKVCTKEVILYIVFGILTTVVNLGTFYIMNSLLLWDENVSNIIAIVLAVLFAYITNKDLVFHSEARKIKERLIQFFKFMLGRAFTMVVEIIGVFLLNDVLHAFYNFGDNIGFLIDKCIITVIVIILNFFISKFFAFKRK